MEEVVEITGAAIATCLKRSLYKFMSNVTYLLSHRQAGAPAINIQLPLLILGRDSSVGIATRYGLDGPGIESRWRRDFPHPSIPTLGPTQPPIQWVPVIPRL